MKEIEILQDRIRYIDKRRAEIEIKLSRLNTPGTLVSYQMQELETERNELATHRAVANAKLRELAGLDQAERERKTAALARRDALRDARTKAIEKQCLEAAESFESTGDHRNARLWRLEALNARKQAEHEVH